MSFDRSLLSAWKLEHNQYLQQVSLKLGAEAIQFGLLGLWQQIDLERTSCGLDQIKSQVEKTEILSNNALKLIQEITVPGAKSDRSVCNDVRLLGLISLCISRSEQLPGDLFDNLSLHREAVDLFALSVLHSRSFSTATLINEVAPQLAKSSRTFEALITYLSVLSDPTVNRANLLTNTGAFVVTPWPDVTRLFESLISIAGHLHNYKYQEAKLHCEQVLAEFPSCPELRLLYTLSNYFAVDKSEYILSQEFKFPDPFLLYRCEKFLFTPFDRLIYLSAFGDASVRHITIPKALPRLGLDNEFYELRVQLQIQLAHHQNNYFDLQSLVSSHTDQLLRSSGYDPFKLALHSAQLKKLDPYIFTSSTKELELRLPCDLTFVVGLPSPHWSQLQMILRTIDEYAIIDSSCLLKKVFTSFANLVGNGYPVTLDQLTDEQISEFRLSYLQNLAICFGGQDKEEIIDFLPDSFEHIGLLAMAFPESRFIAIHPPIRESIIASYLEVNGFSSSHATATLSELTAYYYDYAEILESWSSILSTRIDRINFTTNSIASDASHLHRVFNRLCEDLDVLMPRGSFEFLDVLDYLKPLSVEIEEYSEDIARVERILTSCLPG